VTVNELENSWVDVLTTFDRFIIKSAYRLAAEMPQDMSQKFSGIEGGKKRCDFPS
jgi:hypothetical protein